MIIIIGGLMMLGAVGVIGFVVYTLMNDSKNTKVKDKDENSKKNISTTGTTNKNNSKKTEVNDTRSLLEFENIEVCNEDVALIKSSDNEYLGVMEIGGISYNLLSYEERVLLEDNYGNMLNGIDFPFQIYIQSRKLDLDNYIAKYNKNLEKHEKKVKTLEEKHFEDESNIEIKKELDKANNIYNYAKQSVEYFYQRNVASNLLSRKYYIIVKYTHNNSTFENALSEREKLECAYNEVVNKAIAFEDSLVRNGLTCKLIDGLEIAELLYTAYNKEDSSTLKIRNAIEARYNHLYTTAKPIEIKQKEIKLKYLEEQKIELEKSISDKVDVLAEEYSLEKLQVVDVLEEVLDEVVEISSDNFDFDLNDINFDEYDEKEQ